MAGEGRRPTQAHLQRVAEVAGLAAAMARRVVDEVRSVVVRWADFAAEARVGGPSTERVGAAVRTAVEALA